MTSSDSSNGDSSNTDPSSSSNGRRLTERVKAGVERVRRRLRDVDALDPDALGKRLRPFDLDASTLRERLDRIDVAFVERGADGTSPADVERVVDRADDIEHRFQSKGPLARLLDDGRLLLALVKDAWSGRYREVPTWSLTAAAFALLYVLNPLDLVPDALPVVGVIDDAAVVSLVLVLLEQDLQAYRAWRADRAAFNAGDESSSETSSETSSSLPESTP